jgi:hypothetical protein
MLHKKTLFALLLSLTPILLAADSSNKAHTSPVIIDSRPDASEVWIDGKFVGSAPLSYRLTPGDHKIELVHPRYTTWTRTLTVAAEQPTRVAALLETTDKPCK